MAGGRRKSIWHRLLLLIFRCVLFSVKIKLLICAFVCVDLDRFASFRWLKRRPLPPPPTRRRLKLELGHVVVENCFRAPRQTLTKSTLAALSGVVCLFVCWLVYFCMLACFTVSCVALFLRLQINVCPGDFNK